MKYILMLLLLSSSSSTVNPKFAVGECIQSTSYRESWEPEHFIDRIDGIGVRSYRTSYWSPSRKCWVDSIYGISMNGNHKVVPCPDNYKQCKD